MLEKPKKIYFTHIKGTNIRKIFPLLMFQQLLVNKHHRFRDYDYYYLTTPSTTLQKKKLVKSTFFNGQASDTVSDFLKGGYTSPPLTSPSFLIYNNIFDVTKKKSKDYYSLLVTQLSQFLSPPRCINGYRQI